ncbi:MAG: hypothetical protein AAF591_20330, partial [Verrucomicrobiota bacterium]
MPASDQLGHLHVDGKLRCLEDRVVLQYKIRDRIFKKSGKELEKIEFPYSELEEVAYNPNWFRASRLVLKTRDPAILAKMPGSDLGRIDMRVTKKSKKDAAKMEKLVEFKRSEFDAARSHERWMRSAEEEAGVSDEVAGEVEEEGGG